MKGSSERQARAAAREEGREAKEAREAREKTAPSSGSPKTGRAKKGHLFVDAPREEEDESAAQLAKLIVENHKTQTELLECVEEWLKTSADEKAVILLLKALPQKITSPLMGDTSPFRYTRECYESMFEDARKNLELRNQEYLLSSFLEEKWARASKTVLDEACTLRDIGEEGFVKERIRLLCIEERKELLAPTAMTLPCFKAVAKRSGIVVQKQSWKSVAKVAEAMSDSLQKPKFNCGAIPSPLPSLLWLEELHGNVDVQSKEMEMLERLRCSAATAKEAAMIMLYRAVAFARLHDWHVAELTASFTPTKRDTPTKRVRKLWAKIPGFSKASFHRVSALGHFIHRNASLCFQTILSNPNAWQEDRSPSKFEEMLLATPTLQKKSDRLCETYLHLIFPFGVDPPTIRAVPLCFRANPEQCFVKPSGIPEAGDGLFATGNLCVGTTWLMGGECVSSRGNGNAMQIDWQERGAALTLEGREGFRSFGWKANEPPGLTAPNAVLLSSPDGVYLTVCRPIAASPEAPQEVFVYYGDGYERDYDVLRYSGKGWKQHADEDWNAGLEARKALKMVHGMAAPVRHWRQQRRIQHEKE